MQIVSETIDDRIRNFEVELKRIYSSGYIAKTVQLKRYSKDDPTRGVEVFVDVRVTATQVKQITDFIIRNYNFDVHFYRKTHSLKVWYRNAK